jgi:hypothetical protein
MLISHSAGPRAVHSYLCSLSKERTSVEHPEHGANSRTTSPHSPGRQHTPSPTGRKHYFTAERRRFIPYRAGESFHGCTESSSSHGGISHNLSICTGGLCKVFPWSISHRPRIIHPHLCDNEVTPLNVQSHKMASEM